MIEYPDWLQDLHVRQPGESAGEHITRIVRGLQGVSLAHERERLEALFLANETAERAALVASMRTNCGTSMRAIYVLAGVSAGKPDGCDELLDPYEVGMAVSWVLEAARERGALVAASQWRRAGPGWGLHYGTPGRNDDHLEWVLGTPDPHTGSVEHGGGGRVGNAITIARGDIRWSSGRPLRAMIGPERMADNPATRDNPY